MNKPISPLRQRMLDDMTFRNMSPNTLKVYTAAVANFSAFHGRSPDKLGIEDVRAYRLHLIERGLKARLDQSHRRCAAVLLRRDARPVAQQIPFARKEDTPPAVLSQDQVPQLLRTEPNLKMRTAFTTIYAAARPCPRSLR